MGRPNERGSIAVMTGALALVLVTVSAFAVDLGMQRVVRRDLQALADVVALDLARVLDGRARHEYDVSALDQAVAESTDRNDDGVLGDPPTVTHELGTLDASGAFAPSAPADVPTAVRVTAVGAVDFAFVSGRGGAARSAVAQARSGACFKLGSYAARLDAGASVLGPMLADVDASIAFSGADYQALATSYVELGRLLTAEVGAVRFSEVLGASITLADYVGAIVHALEAEAADEQAEDPGDAASLALLSALSAQVDGLTLGVGEVLALATGGASGLSASLNVLDLVVAGVVAAAPDAGFSLPAAVDLGPMSGVDVALNLIQPLQVGCGGAGAARARSAAATLEVSGTAAELPLGAVCMPVLLGCVNRSVTASVTLSGTLAVARATGQLTDVSCGPDSITAAVGDALLNVDLELDVGLKVGGIPVPGGVRATLTGTRSTVGEATVDLSSGDYGTPGVVGGGDSGLPELDTETYPALVEAPLDPLVDDLVNSLVADLDSELLTPVLAALGADLSGADVYAVPTPQCGVPRLVG